MSTVTERACTKRRPAAGGPMSGGGTRACAGFLAGALWVACALAPGAGLAQAPGGPPPVDVAYPTPERIVDWDEYVGRFVPVQDVELRPRVSGFVDEVLFDDGANVNAGDVLFTIDRAGFQRTVDERQAALEEAEASLDLANATLTRTRELVSRNVASEANLDEAQAERAVAVSRVSAARAALARAELDLSYTFVTAPIAGRVSDRRVDVGELVTGGVGEATLLTTIVSIDPIEFEFDAPPADFLRYSRAQILKDRMRGGDVGNQEEVYEARLKLEDETAFERTGRIVFVDNQLGSGSGAIRVKVQVPNPDNLLAPGLFGRIRIYGLETYDAMMVPDAAILADQADRIVFALTPDNVVTPRPVELGPVLGGLRAIRSGIGPDDRIIVSGLLRARPGLPVTPNLVQIGGAAPPAPTAQNAGGDPTRSAD